MVINILYNKMRIVYLILWKQWFPAASKQVMNEIEYLLERILHYIPSK